MRAFALPSPSLSLRYSSPAASTPLPISLTLSLCLSLFFSRCIPNGSRRPGSGCGSNGADMMRRQTEKKNGRSLKVWRSLFQCLLPVVGRTPSPALSEVIRLRRRQNRRRQKTVNPRRIDRPFEWCSRKHSLSDDEAGDTERRGAAPGERKNSTEIPVEVNW